MWSWPSYVWIWIEEGLAWRFCFNIIDRVFCGCCQWISSRNKYKTGINYLGYKIVIIHLPIISCLHIHKSLCPFQSNMRVFWICQLCGLFLLAIWFLIPALPCQTQATMNFVNNVPITLSALKLFWGGQAHLPRMKIWQNLEEKKWK